MKKKKKRGDEPVGLELPGVQVGEDLGDSHQLEGGGKDESRVKD